LIFWNSIDNTSSFCWFA